MTPEELQKVHQRRLKEVLDSIELAESRIIAKATAAVAAARANPDKAVSAKFWLAKQREINDMLLVVRARWNNFIGDKDGGAIVQAVRDGERAATNIIKDAATLSRKMELPYDTKTINALVHDSVATYGGAMDTARTKLTRLFRATQQDLIKEQSINRTMTVAQLSEGTPRTIASELAKQLAKQAEDGQFLTINGQNWSISTYAELVATTRINEAQTIGTIRTCQEYGVDLVQWVASADACDECQYYADEIFSISGTHEDYATLDEQPPLHPRCSCRLSPYIEKR